MPDLRPSMLTPVDGESISDTDVDGHAVRVRSTRVPGLGARPTFVLLHGIGMSDLSLLRLHRTLALTGDVHTIVMPGFGGTRTPRHALSIAQHAAIVVTLLDRLGVGDHVLVGHSMGCQVAIEVALLAGSRASHVVLIAPVCDPRRRTLVHQARSLARDSTREPFGVNAIVFGDYFRCGIRWYLRSLPALMLYRPEERAPQLAVPVLVVRGEDDPIAAGPWCSALVSSLRNGRLVEVPGQRHHVAYSAPAVVAGEILASVAG